MRKTTEPQTDRNERMQAFLSRLPLILGLTSPVWLVVLLVPGSLGNRLLAAGVMLLLLLLFLTGFLIKNRWLIRGAGFLAALGQRQEEKKKGELDDAKKF